jgi:methylphosphotriester-DNA--protein-cysteine methyltransferase
VIGRHDLLNLGLREQDLKSLVGGKPVTASVFDSGFNTKSNFNQEFLRVCGQNPWQCLAARGF